MRSLTVQIPKPCHERWADMQPNAQGRFCASCQKTVVDYTALSDQELVRILAQSSEKSCGRFRDEQLNRPLLASNPGAVSGWRQWLGLLTMSLFGWQTARAQHTQTDRPSRPVSAQQASVRLEYAVTAIPVRTTVGPETKSILTGMVMTTDSSGNLSPVAEAFVSIEGSGEKYQALTDRTGAYKILFPTRLMPTRLTVYARTPGRQRGSITFDIPTSAASIVLDDLIMEQPAPMKTITGGGIVLIKPPTRWQKLKRKLIH